MVAQLIRTKLKFKFVLMFFASIFCFMTLTVNADTPAQAAAKSSAGPVYWPTYPKPIIKPGMSRKLIAKGEYLVKMGDCISCHTNTRNYGKPFAGGYAINTPFGTFFTPNITPDKETGIGKWTNADFIRALHDGINPKGQYYFPVFPYTSFNRVSNQDLLAIKAYLEAIPAVYKKNKAPTAPWPFSWRFSQLFWRMLFFKAQYYQYNPAHSKQWNRGAYIVQGLGHCGECHTPRNFLGAMEPKHYLTGAFVGGFWAPDVSAIGLETARKQTVVGVFTKRELIDEAGPVRGPMDEVDHNSLKYMAKSDLEAIATYLKTVKSVQPRVPYVSPSLQKQIEPAKTSEKFDPATIKAGHKVYDKVCAICHDSGMVGAPMIYDTPNWTRRLGVGGIELFYKHAIAGFNLMPAKGACVTCTDNEIKAAVDYIVSESQNPSQMRLVRAAKTPKPDVSLALGKQVYDKVCSECHRDGKLGAPKLNDQAAWAPIVKKNADVLIVNTLKGIGNMPPKGGCSTCTTADVIASVKYMMQQVDPKGDYSLW